MNNNTKSNIDIIQYSIDANPLEVAVAGSWWANDGRPKRETDDPYELIDKQNHKLPSSPVHGTYHQNDAGNYIEYLWDVKYYEENESVDMAMPDHSFFDHRNIKKTEEGVKAIVDFYKSMFTMKKLGDADFNSWQKAVYEYIFQDNPNLISRNMIGLYTKLPAAYENDLELERCFKLGNVTFDAANLTSDERQKLLDETLELEPIGAYNNLRQSNYRNLIFRDQFGNLFEMHLDESDMAGRFLYESIRNNDDVIKMNVERIFITPRLLSNIFVIRAGSIR